MPSTTNLAIPYPSATVPPDVPGDIYRAVKRIDDVLGHVGGDGGWAPGYGGDGGATIGANGGTNGAVARVGAHFFYSGRVLFGSSAVAGGAVITGVNFGAHDTRFSYGRGHYRVQGGARWAVVLTPLTASEYQVLVVRDTGLAGFSSLGNPPQSSELIFDIHAVNV